MNIKTIYFDVLQLIFGATRNPQPVLGKNSTNFLTSCSTQLTLKKLKRGLLRTKNLAIPSLGTEVNGAGLLPRSDIQPDIIKRTY